MDYLRAGVARSSDSYLEDFSIAEIDAALTAAYGGGKFDDAGRCAAEAAGRAAPM